MASNGKVTTEEMVSGPIVPLLIKMALPIFAGMSLQIFYNITDTFWVSRIDMNDPGIVGGVGIIFPIMFLAMALSSGLQTGISVLITRSIGEKREDKLAKVPSNGLFIAVILSILVIGLSYTFASNILHGMGAKGSYYINGYNYLIAIIPATVAMFLLSITNGILQGEGLMKPLMFTMFIGTIGNLILDPIFIFPLGLGVKGAAYATVFAQIISLLYGISIFIKGKSIVKFHFRLSAVNRETLSNILRIGVPQILSLSIMALSNFALNKIIIDVDEHAFTAFALCSRFDIIQLIPILALSSALITIVGRNFGSGNSSRIKAVWRTSLVMAGVVEVGLALLLIATAPYIYPNFSDIPSVVSYTIEQTRTVNIFFVAAVFGILARAVFQGLNTPMPALFFTVLRLFLISIPFVIFFVYKLHWGIHGVWYGVIIGNVTSGITSFIWTERVLNRRIRENDLVVDAD